MPVTIEPSPSRVGKNHDRPVKTSAELLSVSPSCTLDHRRLLRYQNSIAPDTRQIIQSSFTDLESSNPPCIIPYSNGFVIGIIRAFQQDLHLVLRPDDVWLCILTQFNFYVNGRAEEMRSLFVEHEGKKELIIDVPPVPLSEQLINNFTLKITCLIEENIKDQKFRDWIMPNFSTTTETDRAVAAIVMMGTLQNYFEYTMRRGCGFPSVVLLGEKKDWEKLLRRVRELPKYGEEAREWSFLLIPVLCNMIKSFESPHSQEIKDFWLRACYQAGMDGSGSGVETISGWITAFCFWSEKGQRIKSFEDASESSRDLETPYSDRKRLVLNGVELPLIRPRDIPAGLVSVPVKIEDHLLGLERMTTMTAGLAGMTATKKTTNVNGDVDCFQPRSGWWMLESSRKPIGI